MKDKAFETQAIRTQIERSAQQEHSNPIYMTSSFTFEDSEEMRAAFADEIDRNIYSRFVNPNHTEFEAKMCLLEGTEDAFAVASGMAAMFSSMAALLSSGDHIVACRSIFGSTHTVLNKILPKWNITHTYVDVDDQDNWQEAIQGNTKMFVVETPTNPAVAIVDLEKLGRLCKSKGVILLVDNCFATPYLQQPSKYGADLVAHSATKFIDGQGRAVGGIVCGKKELVDQVRAFGRSTGPALSPFNSWLFSKSLETLGLRMDRHCSNAEHVADFLESHEKVEAVFYPFNESHPQFELAKKQMKLGGGIVTLIIKGGIDAGKRFLDGLELSSLTANLGDSRTIITHPASTTHAKLTDEERLVSGILPGLIRISVGLENEADIIKDIEQALNKV